MFFDHRLSSSSFRFFCVNNHTDNNTRVLLLLTFIVIVIASYRISLIISCYRYWLINSLGARVVSYKSDMGYTTKESWQRQMTIYHIVVVSFFLYCNNHDDYDITTILLFWQLSPMYFSKVWGELKKEEDRKMANISCTPFIITAVPTAVTVTAAAVAAKLLLAIYVTSTSTITTNDTYTNNKFICFFAASFLFNSNQIWYISISQTTQNRGK